MKRLLVLSAFALPALAAACSASTDSKFAGSGSSGTGVGSGAGGGDTLDVSVGVGSGGGTSNCNATDQICDNELANPTKCDDGLALSEGDPMAAVRALDICKVSTNGGWGVVSAKYVRADGSPATAGKNTGIAPKFGNAVVPQGGSNMLVLSSGHARDLSMPDPCLSQTCETMGPGTPPPNFPQDVPNCPGAKDINDDIGLEVALIAPKNAKGYQFNFAFTSFEFAEWVCTEFNDQFIALVSPPPAGSVDGNISFDSKKNPVSVNLALFDHCDQSTLATFAQSCQLFGSGVCPPPPNPYCPQGPGFLGGTGFGGLAEWGDAGSTGWLVTTAPVNGGDQFTIRFAIWDTGDTALDSTVVLDNFRWSADPVGIGTDEVDNPK
jgi:hypothetical protein